MCPMDSHSPPHREESAATPVLPQQFLALQEVGNRLSRAGSVDELCRRAVELGREQLGFDRLGIWFVAAGGGAVTGSFGVDEEGRLRDERGSRIAVSPESLAGQVMASPRGLALRHEAAVLNNRGEVVGHASHAIAALWDGEEVIGLLCTDNLLRRQPIEARECELLTLFASTLGHLCTLKRAEEALRRADRHKDEFLAVLAHELRNPLGVIGSALEIQGRDEAPPESRRRARERARRQFGQITRLVDDLLDLARISEGKIEVRLQVVDLAAVVLAAVESSLPLIEARRHRLSLSLPSEPLRVDADPGRLEQVVANLLANAARYTNPGGDISLSVSLAAARESTGQEFGAADAPPPGSFAPSTIDAQPTTVRLGVLDSGIGITPELLPRIFDLFSQGGNPPAHALGGLGIGLAMVRRLVELHGGTAEARSEGPGRGSEFIVSLPLAVESPETTARSVADLRSAFVPIAEPRALSPELRVLVVDDNRDAGETLLDLLQLWGCQARWVGDGSAALETAAAFQPDAVLLDIGLPGIDGYEVARRLRADPELGRALLVAVTGYGQPEYRQRSREAGIDHHLVKPVNVADLHSLLHRESN